MLTALSSEINILNVDNIRRGTLKGPVRVELESEYQVRSLLRKAPNLRNHSRYRNIYLAPERTLEERLHQKSLVMKLKQKITEEPAKRWAISKGQIVLAAPKEPINTSEISELSDDERVIYPDPMTTRSKSMAK